MPKPDWMIFVGLRLPPATIAQVTALAHARGEQSLSPVLRELIALALIQVGRPATTMATTTETPRKTT